MMVEAFDSWRTAKRAYDYGRFFDEWSDRDIKEMVNANRELPVGHHLVDRQRDPGLHEHRRGSRSPSG